MKYIYLILIILIPFFCFSQAGGIKIDRSVTPKAWIVDGNVGIGTTSPSYPLQVRSSSTAGYFTNTAGDVIASLFDGTNAGYFQDANSNTAELATGSYGVEATLTSGMAAGYFTDNNSNITELANATYGISATKGASGTAAGYFVNGGLFASMANANEAGRFSDGTRVAQLANTGEAVNAFNGSDKSVYLGRSNEAGLFEDSNSNFQVYLCEDNTYNLAGYFTETSSGYYANLAESSRAGYFGDNGAGNYAIMVDGSYGVYGGSSNNTGVQGYSGNYYGMYGESASSSYYGVTGYNSNGTGVYGEGASGYYGVYGNSNDGTGVFGGSGSSSYYGVHGYNSSGTGIYGEASSSSYYGIYGSNSSGTAIYGYSSGSGYYGVYGVNSDGSGIAGQFYNSSTGYDVSLADGSYAVNASSGDIYCAGNVIAAACCPSDIRLKKNVKTIPDALSKVLKLRGVEFQWKKNDEKHYGVIAQELEKIMPFAILENKGYKYVSYNDIIGVLIQAAKEQQRIIDKLHLDNRDLDSRIKALEEK